MPPLVLSLEGNIGSGKTTLFEALKRRFADSPHIVFLSEPLHDWNTVVDSAGTTILQKYYSDQVKYAFSFQMLAFTSRLAALRAALRSVAVQIIVTERSLCTDSEIFAQMLYHDGKLEDVEYQIYLKCFHEFIGEQPPIYFVYLKTDPLVALERVQRRSRPGEAIPLAYLANCDQYHDRWLLAKPADQLLQLDANADIRLEPALLEHWVGRIETFLYYLQ
jgi:deoxyadenosine/deoxycytidine kinase